MSKNVRIDLGCRIQALRLKVWALLFRLRGLGCMDLGSRL